MILSTLLNALAQSKAKNIQTLDIQNKTPLVDTLVICTATSTRHSKSIGEMLIKLAKSQKENPIGVEGLMLGEWVLVDLGATIVHIMLEDVRSLYELDKLWAAA